LSRQLRTRQFMGSLTDQEREEYLARQQNGTDEDRHRNNLLKRIGIYDPEAIWVAQENKVILPTI